MDPAAEPDGGAGVPGTELSAEVRAKGGREWFRACHRDLSKGIRRGARRAVESPDRATAMIPARASGAVERGLRPFISRSADGTGVTEAHGIPEVNPRRALLEALRKVMLDRGSAPL